MAGVDEQLIMETTGHRSKCVRQYKRTSEELLRAAQETVSTMPEVKKAKTNSTDRVQKEQAGFGEDIIEVDKNGWFDSNVLDSEVEIVSYKVNTGGKPSRAHKNPCLSKKTTGDCTDLCSVLKKVDQKTEAYKNKKHLLSLQFKKTHCGP